MPECPPPATTLVVAVVIDFIMKAKQSIELCTPACVAVWGGGGLNLSLHFFGGGGHGSTETGTG